MPCLHFIYHSGSPAIPIIAFRLIGINSVCHVNQFLASLFSAAPPHANSALVKNFFKGFLKRFSLFTHCDSLQSGIMRDIQLFGYAYYIICFFRFQYYTKNINKKRREFRRTLMKSLKPLVNSIYNNRNLLAPILAIIFEFVKYFS